MAKRAEIIIVFEIVHSKNGFIADNTIVKITFDSKKNIILK